MYSLGRAARIGSGFGIVVAAGFILSACTAQQNPPDAGQVATTGTTTTATTATPAPVAEPVPAKATTSVDACASATKAALEAALKADKTASAALLVDSSGLQHIKCVAPWAHARFSNEIDGGSVLFVHRNGKWILQGGGTGQLCENVPAAIAGKICGEVS